MINVGIIGATGYAGIELVRILLSHCKVNICAVSSVSFEGQDISDIYPSLSEIFTNRLENEDAVINKSDVVFAALPHGLSEKAAKKCYDEGKVFIDLGADFRLYDENEYTEWYKGEYTEKQLHKNSVYGLCEIYRDKIKGKKIIANPGCYPTSIGLALYPLLKKYKNLDNIIIDSKSGVTGAGRGLSLNTHFPENNEAFSAYKIASHRHTPEIEQTLSEIAQTKIKVTFVPHLLPVNRGIESTIYVKLSQEVSLDEIYDLYKEQYANEQFVRIKKDPVNIKNVRCSNYCDISIHLDQRTNTLIICSAIDNMVKGAAGQAVQNMNIALGFEENEGLNLIPTCF